MQLPKKVKPASININLIPKDPFFQSTVGKFLQWALSIGRYVVIFTELIVILSFVARFTLDRQVTDLNNKIEQKRVVIRSYGDLEQNFRNLQKKIDDYSQIEHQLKIANTFPKIQSIVPNNIVLDELVIMQDKVVINGTAFSHRALNELINNISLSTDFFNVVIDNIQTQDEDVPGFLFSISARTEEEVQKVTKQQVQTKR
ncbi:MAG: PilN domain-containing protein [Candidatus Woesebacteria bacterium]|jgi:hypothetical protein